VTSLSTLVFGAFTTSSNPLSRRVDGIRQGQVVQALPARLPRPVSRKAPTQVFGPSDRFQVSGIDALDVSTQVVQVESFTNRPDMTQVEHPMRNTGAEVWPTGNSIPISGQTACPFPALSYDFISSQIVDRHEVTSVDLPVPQIVLSAHATNESRVYGTILGIGSLGA
jgi:hypothetical protein